MSGKQAENAIEFLASIASIIELIATNLDANRLDRRAIRKLLHEYSSRAEADGRLINASRQDPRCVDHGLFLAYVHMEFLSSLAKFNFTIPATSTKWYSWRTLLKKYRLSLFSISSQTAELQKQFGNIKEKAQLLSTDLQTNNVRSQFNRWFNYLALS